MIITINQNHYFFLFFVQVKLYEVLIGQRNIYFALELCTGGDLREYLDTFSKGLGLGESATKRMFWQIARGMQYCHAQNIVHRYVKVLLPFSKHHG